MKHLYVIGFVFLPFLLYSCGELFDPVKMNHVYYQVINHSIDTLDCSLFTYSHGNIYCLTKGDDRILPHDSIWGGLGFYKGKNNSWVDYFEIKEIDSLYLIISKVPLDVKEGRIYERLPNESTVLDVKKYVKEDFDEQNPETDIFTYIYQ